MAPKSKAPKAAEQKVELRQPGPDFTMAESTDVMKKIFKQAGLEFSQALKQDKGEDNKEEHGKGVEICADAPKRPVKKIVNGEIRKRIEAIEERCAINGAKTHFKIKKWRSNAKSKDDKGKDANDEGAVMKAMTKEDAELARVKEAVEGLDEKDINTRALTAGYEFARYEEIMNETESAKKKSHKEGADEGLDEKEINTRALTAGYKFARYEEIMNEMKSRLVKVGWKKDFIEKTTPFMPISGWMGDNLIKKSTKMEWWK
jgi:hypothetical protein